MNKVMHKKPNTSTTLQKNPYETKLFKNTYL